MQLRGSSDRLNYPRDDRLARAALAGPTCTKTPLALRRNRAIGSLVLYLSEIAWALIPLNAAFSKSSRGRRRHPPNQSASSSCSTSQVRNFSSPTRSVTGAHLAIEQHVCQLVRLIAADRPSVPRGLHTTTLPPLGREEGGSGKASGWSPGISIETRT